MNHRTRLGTQALLLGAAALFLTESAGAYCRSRTCNPRTESCETTGTCVTSGFELYRTSSCVSFDAQEDASPTHGLDADLVESLVQDAFDRWTSADCGGGQGPSIGVVSNGPVECDAVEYSSNQGNANIVIFRDDVWPETNDANAFALTTVSFSTKTGEIYDADMEVNGTVPNLTFGDPSDGVDLPSIFTHETGHFLGLAHASDPTAVMRPRYQPRVDDLRTLTDDDIQGICAVYPPDREVSTNSCTPRHGFQSTCATPGGELAASGGGGLAEKAGCSLSGPDRRTTSGLSLLGVIALLGLGLRRRSRKARAVRRALQ